MNDFGKILESLFWAAIVVTIIITAVIASTITALIMN